MRQPKRRRGLVWAAAILLAGGSPSLVSAEDASAASGESQAHAGPDAETQPGGPAALLGDLLQPFRRRDAEPEPPPSDRFVQIVEKGSSSRTDRRDAATALPLDRLSRDDRQQVDELLSSVGLFRRLPKIAFDVEPAVYDYFCRHPDVAVGIWRVLEISEFDMSRTGPDQYEADTGEGTEGTIRLLHRGANELLVLCDGELKSPLLPRPIKARALLHLETTWLKNADGRPRAEHRLSMFVSFPSQTVETMARLLSPVSHVMIDRNFREVSLFLHMMTLAMTRQPGWVEQITTRLDKAAPDSRRELIEVTARTYVAERKRQEHRRIELHAPLHPPIGAPFPPRAPANGGAPDRPRIVSNSESSPR